MSAIASAHLIEKEKVQELKKMAGIEPEVKKSLFGKVKENIDPYWEWFQKNTSEVSTYEGSGFIYPTLVVYLQEKKGADLLDLEMKDLSNYLTEKKAYLMILFTPEDAVGLAPKLDPSSFSGEEMSKYYEEFNETEPPPPVQMVEAIAWLRDALLKVRAGQVLIFQVV